MRATPFLMPLIALALTACDTDFLFEGSMRHSQPQVFEDYRPDYPPLGLAMSKCRQVTLTTETIDVTSRTDAPGAVHAVTLYAEAPQTTAERARGMQHRAALPDRAAMLFEFEGEHSPVLWMKDTPASLDMVFFTADGMATHMEIGTEPFSEAFLGPEDPDPVAKYALELKAGAVDRYDLVPGVTRMMLGPLEPCAFADRSGNNNATG